MIRKTSISATIDGMLRPRYNPELARQVGQRIKNLRRNRGKTLEQIADRLDSQVGYLCDLEAGRKVASLPMLADLAKCLGVEVFALFVDPEHDDR